jgi:hypothetical protein
VAGQVGEPAQCLRRIAGGVLRPFVERIQEDPRRLTTQRLHEVLDGRRGTRSLGRVGRVPLQGVGHLPGRYSPHRVFDRARPQDILDSQPE